MNHAICSNNPIAVELLLQEYHANPNVVDKENRTALMYFARATHSNLSILRLLVKYRFDFARLVNQHENESAYTVFHLLCLPGDIDHNIVCLKHLFSICRKIPNCAINILARDSHGMCGLHHAIHNTSIDMTNYLLENIYFPNNDKLNRDGIAFINMRIYGQMSLPGFFMSTTMEKGRNVTRDLEMFKLLISYGMKFNSQDEAYFATTIGAHYTELVAFILNQNLCPIGTFEKIICLMYKMNGEFSGSVNLEILKALYNYGLGHDVISNKSHHAQIIIEAAKYNLTTFKTTLSMILEKHGIDDLKQYKQCDTINRETLETIVKSPNATPDVKSFIQALLTGDETKLVTLDEGTTNKVVLTCINNHELKTGDHKKIINWKENCSVCGDNHDGSQLLSGFKCDECKSFMCDDCIIARKISTKIKNNHHNKSVLSEARNEILEYKNNKKLLNKVELLKFKVKFLYFVFVVRVCILIRLPNNVQMQFIWLLSIALYHLMINNYLCCCCKLGQMLIMCQVYLLATKEA